MTTETTRLTAVWLTLSAFTVIAWLVVHTGAGLTAQTLTTIGVLALGLVKSRLILWHFMEIRTAPQWLRIATDVWLVVLWGGILGAYVV